MGSVNSGVNPFTAAALCRSRGRGRKTLSERGRGSTLYGNQNVWCQSQELYDANLARWEEIGIKRDSRLLRRDLEIAWDDVGGRKVRRLIHSGTFRDIVVREPPKAGATLRVDFQANCTYELTRELTYGYLEPERCSGVALKEGKAVSSSGPAKHGQHWTVT